VKSPFFFILFSPKIYFKRISPPSYFGIFLSEGKKNNPKGRHPLILLFLGCSFRKINQKGKQLLLLFLGMGGFDDHPLLN
jgi:hypothetical protein